MLIHILYFSRKNLDNGRGLRSRRSRIQAMVIIYEVIIESVTREKMALSAVELPMLIRGIKIATIRDTRSALIGISYVSFVYIC